MALPPIQFKYGVQSLGREGLGGPSAVADANTLAARAVDKVGTTIGYTVRERWIEDEINGASDSLALQKAQWFKKHSQKKTYTPDEVPEGIDVRRYDEEYDEETGEMIQVDREIPAHEVQPYMFQQFMNKTMKSVSGKVTESTMKRKWNQKLSMGINAEFAQLLVDSEAQRVSYWNDKWLAGYKESLAGKDYDRARALTTYMEIPEAKRVLLAREIDETEETDQYFETMMTGSLKEVEEQIDYLEDTEKYPGVLTNEDRSGWVSQLRARRNQLLSDQHQTNQALVAQLKDKASDYITQLDAGLFTLMPMDEMKEVYRQLVYHGETIKAKDLKMSIELGGFVTAFQSYAPQEQQFMINQLRKEASESNFGRFALLKAEKVLAQAREGLTSNNLDYVNNTRQIKIDDLDFQNLDDWARGITLRNHQVDKVNQQFGGRETFLKAHELPLLEQTLANMSTQEQFNFVAQTAAVLGKKSFRFFEQAKNAGVAPALMMAGQLYQKGDALTAQRIVDGAELRRGDQAKDIVEGVVPEAKTFIRQMYGGVMHTNHRQYGAAVDAMINAYIAQTKNYHEFDSDLMDDVVQQVLGGVFDYKGSTVSGIPERDFKAYLKNLTPQAIDVMGRPKDVPNTVVLSKIRSGDFELNQMSAGYFTVMDVDSGAMVMDKSGDPFIFKYGVEAPSISDDAGLTPGKPGEAADRFEKNAFFNLNKLRKLLKEGIKDNG